MPTRSEKLRDFIGEILCDICKQKKTFDNQWLMTDGEAIVCPDCQPIIKRKGKVLVSI